MEVPIDVKDIPLPGEDLQNTINTEINNLTQLESDIVSSKDGAEPDNTDIPALLDDVQKLVDNTYEQMTEAIPETVPLSEDKTDDKTEEQLLEEQAAEAIAECIDLPEMKEPAEPPPLSSKVETHCEIITETPDDSFELTLNASDLEEMEKHSTVAIEVPKNDNKPHGIEKVAEKPEPMEVDALETIVEQTAEVMEIEEVVSEQVETDSVGAVYIVEEISETIVVEQKDLVPEEKANVVEVTATVVDVEPIAEKVSLMALIAENETASKEVPKKNDIVVKSTEEKTETIPISKDDVTSEEVKVVSISMEEIEAPPTVVEEVAVAPVVAEEVELAPVVEKAEVAPIVVEEAEVAPVVVEEVEVAPVVIEVEVAPVVKKVAEVTSAVQEVEAPMIVVEEVEVAPTGKVEVTSVTVVKVAESVPEKIVPTSKETSPVSEPVTKPETNSENAETKSTSEFVPVVQSPTTSSPKKPSQAEKARAIKVEYPNVPCHVLGRNIDNPQEDLVSNGRTPPKPRLGVKVPYRNLTSQIVSRQDIANEIIERAAKRNPDPDPPLGGDIFFAKKLTQRLATKIALKNPLAKINVNKPEKIDVINTALLDASRSTITKVPVSQTINDKSDLLAILEGEVEVDLAKEVGSKKSDEAPPILVPETDRIISKTICNTPPKLDVSDSNTPKKKIMDPEIERIIALKQLEQFPKRSLRGRNRKQNLQEQVQGRENLAREIELLNPDEKPAEPAKTSPETKPKPAEVAKPRPAEVAKPKPGEVAKLKPEEVIKLKPVVEIKKIDLKMKKLTEKLSIVDDFEPLMPRSKVTKTYSRKDPIVVVPPDLAQIVDDNYSQNDAKINGDPDDAKSEKVEKNPNKSEKTEKKSDKAEKKSDKVEKKSDKAERKADKKEVKKVKKVEEINKPEVNLVSKRARVIKRKVIWDPDEAPARVSISPKKSIDDKSKKVQKKLVEKKETEPKKEEKEPEKKPDEEKKTVSKMLTKAKKILRLKKSGKVILKKTVKGKIIRSANGTAISVKTKKPIVLKKKVKAKMTELDRLLMDEGAVNMLYNVRRDKKFGKKGVISLDRAQKDLETRTRAVKDVITMSTQEDSPKALRRNVPPPLAIPVAPPPRKKSRDSLRSSLQSPPPSPSFFYSRAEASRIIRRHSSSFSSECSTPRRMSIDQTAEKDKTEPKKEEKDEKPAETAPVKRKKGVPIFIRKADEKTYKGKQKTETSDTTKAQKRKLSDAEDPPRKRTRSSLAGVVETPSPKKTKKPDKFSELTKQNDENQSENEKRVSSRNTYKEISVRRIENLVQIILTPTTTKIKNAVNVQMFNELCEILTKLGKDESCRVVLMSSTDNYFCHGIDFSTLMHANADKRLIAAQETAKAVKDFLMTLAFFPKPLVAGVQGPAVGLGVTMLPLFDLVLASDKATFATPYVKLGHVPEGAILLASPHINGSVLTSELLFACRKLTASEALQHGLVTRVLWPDKFQEELIPIAKAVSKQSSQCMVATKRVLRKSMLADLQSALDEETKLLVDQWTSSECQQNFKKLLQENEWW